MNCASQISEFIDLLAQQSRVERRKAIRSIIDILNEGDIEALEPLIKALADDDLYVQLKAAKGLGIIRDILGVPPLIMALKDLSAEIRIESAKALGLIGDLRAVEPLCGSLNDIDNRVKSEAAIALGRIKNSSSSDSLPKASKKNNNLEVTRQMSDPIIKIDPNIIPIMMGEIHTIKKEKEHFAIKNDAVNDTLSFYRELNYFSVAGDIIESIFEKYKLSLNDDNFIDNLKNRAYKMQEEYYRDQTEIDYSDSYNQIIYLFKYVPLHADLLRCILEQENCSLRKCIWELHSRKEQINILMIGCGPGTELLGFAKWIEKQSFNGKINLKISMLDGTPEWEFCCREMSHQITEILNSKLILSDMQFYHLDIVDFKVHQKYSNLFQEANIYIMSYMFSEIYKDPFKLKMFQEIINEIANKSRKGSRILFIDRCQTGIRDKLDRILRTSGIKDIHHYTNFGASNKNYASNNEGDNYKKKNFTMRNRNDQSLMTDNLWNCLCAKQFKPLQDASAFWSEGMI